MSGSYSLSAVARRHFLNWQGMLTLPEPDSVANSELLLRTVTSVPDHESKDKYKVNAKALWCTLAIIKPKVFHCPFLCWSAQYPNVKYSVRASEVMMNNI
jgi:hypothetical protein